MTNHDRNDDNEGAITHEVGGTEIISIGEALARNWVDVWYQPKIDLRQKCLAGAEALVCIHHPLRGILWPNDFRHALGHADAAKLAEHSLRTVLRHWSEFSKSGFNLRLSVNISATALHTLSVATLISVNRPQSETWPGLTLEVTEDEIVRDVPLTQQVANELKSTGVVFAIDEFGAGYSSLSNLRGLPFTELKLHGSFVKNCAVDVTNAAICQTAIDLAHRFGSAAAAVGIDNMADLQALIVMGCNFGQGPLLAPARPKDEFLAGLRQHLIQPPAAVPPQERSDRAAS